MRSIRLSLLVYFLGLLAVALAAASLLVYRNAQQTLQAKQEAMEKLIEAQYKDSRRKEEEQLDANLLAQAQSLARLVQVQIEWIRSDYVPPLFLLGLLSASTNPSGYMLWPIWIEEGMPPPRVEPPESPEPPNPLYQNVRRHIPPSTRLKLDQLVLPRDGYFQIDSPPSQPYHSPSMADRNFPLDASAFQSDEVVHWVFDDTKLDPDIPVRRVVFKASGVSTVFSRGPRRPPKEPAPVPETGPKKPPPPQPPARRGPTIYVHFAVETDKHNAALAGLAQRRNEDLAKVAAETQESLHDLRFWLLGISMAVFAATVAGSYWLVRLGLSPLRRLSDAVSRVSPKDFRLPLDERRLPRELRPIAGRLSSTLDLLKRAFAREKQASADISHELRTPLAALLTTTEIALRKPRSVEQYREMLRDCQASAQQMNQIVERLLTLARLDAGVDRLRPQAVDAAALARQCATVIRPLAEARGLKLTVEEPRAAPPVPGGAPAGGDGACLVQIDPDKLREVLTNLLHNAIQYNRPGGMVGLRVARENGSLEVEVRDTGIGIAPEAREHIFERFYRADPSRGGDDLHAGLGLAIVKEYIDLMGGSIGVESVEGQGSTFRILLPVR